MKIVKYQVDDHAWTQVWNHVWNQVDEELT